MLASADLTSTRLTLVESAAEFGGNLILAGDGVTRTGGAILEINPDTCEVVDKYEFGSFSSTSVYSVGDISESSTVYAANGKIYAKFSQVNASGTEWIDFLAEADNISSLSTAGTVSENGTIIGHGNLSAIRAIDDTLYVSEQGDNSGLFKVNSLTSLEKIIDEETWHFDSDGGEGFYYTTWGYYDGTDSGGYVRYLNHWDGTASSKIYDIGAFSSSSVAHELLGFVKYDSAMKALCLTKESYAAASADGQTTTYGSRWEGTSLLVFTPASDGTMTISKEFSGGNVISFAVVEDLSSYDGASTTLDEIPLPSSVIEAVDPSEISSGVLEQIAQTVSPDLHASDIKFITSAQIGTAVNPLKSVYDAIKRDSHEAVYKMNQLEVQEDGWYIFRVNVPKEYQGQSAESFKIYLANQNVFSTTQTAALAFGLINAVELDSLGLKLETMPAQFLAVAFLQASTPFSVFLGKLLLALLTGGCNVAAGFGIIVLGAIAFLKFRKQR